MLSANFKPKRTAAASSGFLVFLFRYYIRAAKFIATFIARATLYKSTNRFNGVSTFFDTFLLKNTAPVLVVKNLHHKQGDRRGL